MNFLSLGEYDIVHEILEHRVNEEGNYEYLVKVETLLPLDEEYIESRSANMCNVWVLDNFAMVHITTTYRYTRISCPYSTLAKLLWLYRTSKGINVMYCFVEDPSELENFELIKYLKNVYPSYQLIHDIGHDITYGPNIFQYLNSGDMLYYHSLGFPIISAYDLTAVKIKIMYNVSYGDAVFITNKIRFSDDLISNEKIIEEFKSVGVDVIDHNYLEERKIQMMTIASGTHTKLGKDSSLYVLPAHLIRKICFFI